MTRLRLLSFWIKHQDQTSCVVGVTTSLLVWTTLVMINALKEQKCLKETWASDNNKPDYVFMTLDASLAAKAFEKVKTYLTHVWGATGVQLSMSLDISSYLRTRMTTLPL